MTINTEVNKYLHQSSDCIYTFFIQTNNPNMKMNICSLLVLLLALVSLCLCLHSLTVDESDMESNESMETMESNRFFFFRALQRAHCRTVTCVSTLGITNSHNIIIVTLFRLLT